MTNYTKISLVDLNNLSREMPKKPDKNEYKILKDSHLICMKLIHFQGILSEFPKY